MSNPARTRRIVALVFGLCIIAALVFLMAQPRVVDGGPAASPASPPATPGATLPQG